MGASVFCCGASPSADTADPNDPVDRGIRVDATSASTAASGGMFGGAGAVEEDDGSPVVRVICGTADSLQSPW